jgi:hypothetical protein
MRRRLLVGHLLPLSCSTLSFVPSFANFRSSFVCELSFFLRCCARPRLTSFLPSRDSRLGLVTFPERSYKEFQSFETVMYGLDTLSFFTIKPNPNDVH